MSKTQQKVRDLERILKITRDMAATPDLDVLLNMIISATCEVLRCERASIFLYDKEHNELFSRVATGVDGIRFPADRGVAGAAAMRKRIVNVPDAYVDDRFNRDIDRQTGYRTRNLLTIPLTNIDGELTGVLQAVNKLDGAFNNADENLAETLSAQTGVALHRGRLLAEFAEKQRMTRELDLARKIQLAQLPERDPQIDGYDITGWNLSADETGGDSFNFIPLDNGRLAIMLADATGHGIGAALIIAQFHASLRALLSLTDDVAEIATRINRLLVEDLTGDRFVTAFIGVLDPRESVIRYVAAGQAPLLLITEEQVCVRNATGLPLGIVPDEQFRAAEFALPPCSIFALLTDGFYETAKPSGELFGLEGVTTSLQRRAELPVHEMVAALHRDVKQFSNNAAQADDLTAIIVRRNGK